MCLDLFLQETPCGSILSHSRVSAFLSGVIFMRARVSLALVSLRKNVDYS